MSWSIHFINFGRRISDPVSVKNLIQYPAFTHFSSISEVPISSSVRYLSSQMSDWVPTNSFLLRPQKSLPKTTFSQTEKNTRDGDFDSQLVTALPSAAPKCMRIHFFLPMGAKKRWRTATTVQNEERKISTPVAISDSNRSHCLIWKF
jgi:hypothetical protein